MSTKQSTAKTLPTLSTIVVLFEAGPHKRSEHRVIRSCRSVEEAIAVAMRETGRRDIACTQWVGNTRTDGTTDTPHDYLPAVNARRTFNIR